MHLFRRSISSGSSKSRTTTLHSNSDTSTPRTSLDSTAEDEVPESLSATIKPVSLGPIIRLPVELVQQITSYLDDSSAASFCLSSRFICYAVGTNHLSGYISAAKSRFEKRKTIETLVERAFPGHWFCAWCDKFHPWSATAGPLNTSREKHRDCADYNSYLLSSDTYTLRYHHIRLALNRHLWGPQHGIPLSAFTHTATSMVKIFKTPVSSKLHIATRIVQSRFLLHTSFAIVLPAWATRNKNLLRHLWPALPHLLAGHRDSANGHTGLMAAIDNVVRRGWTYSATQTCTLCAADWSISAHEFLHATGSQVRLEIRAWRDLGDGRNPFDSGWRAHGVCVEKAERLGKKETVRFVAREAGDIRGLYEDCRRSGDENSERENETAIGNTRRSFSRSRSRSRGASPERADDPSRPSIYRSFMKSSPFGEPQSEVRRSRARPRTWRTRSENEEAERLEDEELRDMSRDAGELLVRLSTGREW